MTVVGKTTLSVRKARFLAGHDVFTLFTNPPAGGLGPGSNVVKRDLKLGPVPRIGIYSTGAFIVDAIRIGTTFADVMPIRDGAPDDKRLKDLEGRFTTSSSFAVATALL